MTDIPIYVHDGSVYLEPRYVLKNEVEKEIQAWKDAIFEKAKEVNADHFIYATKTYNAIHDYLKRVDLYYVPLKDEEFHKRIDNSNTKAIKECEFVWYGVWHKGTAY